MMFKAVSWVWILLLYIFGCSFNKSTGISIVFVSPLLQTQCVFDPSEVNLSWYYKVNGTFEKPTVSISAEMEPGSYKRVLLLLGGRTVVLKSPYRNRLTGWRNASFTLVTIRNLTLREYINYKITLGLTSLPDEVEAVKILKKEEKPTKPIITCGTKEEISKIIVKEGDDIECSCSSTGLPLPVVAWKLPEISSNGSFLKMEKISRNEINSYTCVASNQYGSQSESVLEVKVQYPPSLPEIISTSRSSFIGQKVTFICSAKADPTPNYFWKTPNNRTCRFTHNNTLGVILRRSDQFGVYSCSASNTYGNNTSNVTLEQMFVPGEPLLALAKKETFEITVKWSKPDHNGGSIVMAYFVRVYRGEKIITTKKTKQLEYQIDRLHRNTTYTVCVWAKNIVGNGSKSCIEQTTLNKVDLVKSTNSANRTIILVSVPACLGFISAIVLLGILKCKRRNRRQQAAKPSSTEISMQNEIVAGSSLDNQEQSYAIPDVGDTKPLDQHKLASPELEKDGANTRGTRSDDTHPKPLEGDSCYAIPGEGEDEYEEMWAPDGYEELDKSWQDEVKRYATYQKLLKGDSLADSKTSEYEEVEISLLDKTVLKRDPVYINVAASKDTAN